MTGQMNQSKGQNSVASTLEVFAWLTFTGGVIAGFIVGDTLAEYSWEFNFPLALATWVSSFFSGTCLLGFSEIIKLLQRVVDNGSRQLVMQPTASPQPGFDLSDLPKL